jgi:hypothetical protein
MMAMTILKPNSILAIAIATAAHFAPAAASVPETTHAHCSGTEAAGDKTPVPADPYPLMAAGWGPELGNGLMASRWAEDWTGMAQGPSTPALKSIPLRGGASLTFSAEARMRYVATENSRLQPHADTEQMQFRGVVGADLRLNPHVRLYSELGTGQVDRDRELASANFQNRLSLQQLFVDLRGQSRGVLIGTMIGRQEFADGPRQLISLSDGPNLHRTWNGVRVYAHARRFRVGAFELRGTRLDSGMFDDGIDSDTILRGLNASVLLSQGHGPNTYLDPFWFHTEIPGFRLGGEAGPDKRDTYGVRLWGRKGAFRWDWTAVRQTGRTLGTRRIDAWGFFAVQSLALSEQGWKPKLTSHVDLASGGGVHSDGALHNFHPLYASSNYLGEGQFLALSNLLLVSPGLSVTPSEHTTLSFEYGFARRLDANDVVYGGGMRAYAGTEHAEGRDIGTLARLSGTWSPTKHLSFNLNLEHLSAGDVLHDAGYRSGAYTQLGLTYRY